MYISWGFGEPPNNSLVGFASWTRWAVLFAFLRWTQAGHSILSRSICVFDSWPVIPIDIGQSFHFQRGFTHVLTSACQLSLTFTTIRHGKSVFRANPSDIFASAVSIITTSPWTGFSFSTPKDVSTNVVGYHLSLCPSKIPSYPIHIP